MEVREFTEYGKMGDWRRSTIVSEVTADTFCDFFVETRRAASLELSLSPEMWHAASLRCRAASLELSLSPETRRAASLRWRATSLRYLLRGAPDFYRYFTPRRGVPRLYGFTFANFRYSEGVMPYFFINAR